MAAQIFHWVRSGHLPTFQAIIDSREFQALPHRRDIAPLASTGRPLPGSIRRQAAIEGVIGEEIAAAVDGQKPIERALADAERRVNALLADIP